MRADVNTNATITMSPKNTASGDPSSISSGMTLEHTASADQDNTDGTSRNITIDIAIGAAVVVITTMVIELLLYRCRKRINGKIADLSTLEPTQAPRLARGIESGYCFIVTYVWFQLARGGYRMALDLVLK